MKTFRPAFSIIEILVSVLIISGSIIYVLKLHSQNREQIVYISQRNKLSLQDSLFLTEDVIKYHKDRRDAYEILEKDFKVEDLRSRRILKKISRDFSIPEPIDLSPDEEYGPTAIIDEIMLRDKHSSIYFHFKINNF